MPSYTIHTVKSAPAEARETLQGVAQTMGFVPNLLGVMAEAPALAKAYVQLMRLFESTTFSANERQVVLLTASIENECSYCIVAHTAAARRQGVADDVIARLHNGESLEDARLESLRQFTRELFATRGWPAKDVTDAFFAAGYDKQQVLEVVLGIALKTLSNYTNHIADTPADPVLSRVASSNAI